MSCAAKRRHSLRPTPESHQPLWKKERVFHLHQVGRQALPAVGVEVAEGGGHAGGGHAVLHGQHDDLAPRLLTLHQLACEEGVHQQVLEAGVLLVGRLDVVQETGADDAPALRAQETDSGRADEDR